MATSTPSNPSYGTTFSPLRGEPAMGNVPMPFITVTTLTAGATQTLPAAAMVGGLVLHDPTTGTTDTTDTAANIIAAMQGAAVGQSFVFTFVNIADGNETITLAGGTGVTLYSYTPATALFTIVQNNLKSFRVVITALADAGSNTAAAVTIYSLGTAAFA